MCLIRFRGLQLKDKSAVSAAFELCATMEPKSRPKFENKASSRNVTSVSPIVEFNALYFYFPFLHVFEKLSPFEVCGRCSKSTPGIEIHRARPPLIFSIIDGEKVPVLIYDIVATNHFQSEESYLDVTA